MYPVSPSQIMIEFTANFGWLVFDVFFDDKFVIDWNYSFVKSEVLSGHIIISEFLQEGI